MKEDYLKREQDLIKFIKDSQNNLDELISKQQQDANIMIESDNDDDTVHDVKAGGHNHNTKADNQQKLKKDLQKFL